MYLKVGADGLFIEAPHTVEEFERVARTFGGVPLIANMLEGGGKSPILTPSDLHKLGFSMITYPTSIIFRVARAIERALADLQAGRPLPTDDALDFESYTNALGLPGWRDLENEFTPFEAPGSSGKP